VLLTITNHHRLPQILVICCTRIQRAWKSFELSFGHAHVFYPEAACDRCTVALLLDVDPVGLVRNRRGPSGEGGALDQYVNERNFPGTQRFSLYCFGRIDYSLAQSLSFCSDRLSALL